MFATARSAPHRVAPHHNAHAAEADNPCALSHIAKAHCDANGFVASLPDVPPSVRYLALPDNLPTLKCTDTTGKPASVSVVNLCNAPPPNPFNAHKAFKQKPNPTTSKICAVCACVASVKLAPHSSPPTAPPEPPPPFKHTATTDNPAHATSAICPLVRPLQRRNATKTKPSRRSLTHTKAASAKGQSASKETAHPIPALLPVHPERSPTPEPIASVNTSAPRPHAPRFFAHPTPSHNALTVQNLKPKPTTTLAAFVSAQPASSFNAHRGRSPTATAMMKHSKCSNNGTTANSASV